MAKKKQATSETGLKTLTDEVFSQFVSALGKNKGYEHIAIRLKGTLLDEKSLTEPSITAALFDDDAA